MDPRTRRRRSWAIALVFLAGLAVLPWLPPIPQPQAYHAFADERDWLGIPRAGDVLTNLPFVLVGLLGIWRVLRAPLGPGGTFLERWERWPWLAWFLGLALTGFSSGWYHLAPDDAGLFWDRLTLSLVFTAFLPILLAEFGERAVARRWWLALTALGPLSVLWWIWSESRGVGDLRLYGYLQGAPLLLVPLALLLLPSRYSRSRDYLGVLACYVVAKLGELGDAWLLEASGLISGHSLKHLAAAAAGIWLLAMLWRRQALSSAAAPTSGDGSAA